MKDLAIALPVYKQIPDNDEYKNLKQMNLVLGHRDIFLVFPQGLDTKHYSEIFPRINLKPFPPIFFENITGYNKLMLNKTFYETFSDYQYILITQPDVLVFKDELNPWIQENYDYVGAPWHGRKLHFLQYCIAKNGLQHLARLLSQPKLNTTVGNGGFSLRKTQTFIDVCQHDPKLPSWEGNEDYYWSLIARKPDGKALNKPRDIEAARFCIETSPEYYTRFLTTEPMALHAYTKHGKDFWKKTIEGKIPGFFLGN